MEETGSQITYSVPTTFAVKGTMMMMMMIRLLAGYPSEKILHVAAESLRFSGVQRRLDKTCTQTVSSYLLQ